MSVVSLNDRRHSRRLSVDLLDEQHRALRHIALEADLSVSDLVRALIALAIDQQELRAAAIQHAHDYQEGQQVS